MVEDQPRWAEAEDHLLKSLIIFEEFNDVSTSDPMDPL
jgi:hypothetical protein